MKVFLFGLRLLIAALWSTVPAVFLHKTLTYTRCFFLSLNCSCRNRLGKEAMENNMVGAAAVRRKMKGRKTKTFFKE